MHTNTVPGYTRAADVAAKFGVTHRTVKNWCIKRTLPGAVKLSERAPWLIPNAALEGFTPPRAGRPRKTQREN